MIINQLSVFLENKNGQLSEITEILANNGIDIRALNIAETNDYGILRLIVNDERKAALVLSKNNFIVSATKVVMAAVENKPGGLNSILQKMSANGIGIEYMYSIFSDNSSQAHMIFKIDNPEKLEAII